MEKIIFDLYKSGNIDSKKLLYLLKNINEKNKENLFFYARQKRNEVYGKKIFLRALIEFSSYCKNTCEYCGLRCYNKKTLRYRLDNDQIYKSCKRAYDLGVRTFVLQSGEDVFFSDKKLVKIVQNIRIKFPEAAITFSIGEKSYESYKKYYDSGVDRFLLRHETAEKNLYKKRHPGMSFENRIRCLYDMKKIGYQVGSGFIVGLPGQNLETIVEDLIFLKKLNPHMVGIGPFITHDQTPLKDYKNGSVGLTVLCLAIIRLLLPKTLIPSTTALGVLDKNGILKALNAGANVIMPNFSPITARKNYDIYKGKTTLDFETEKNFESICDLILNSGYIVGLERGDYKNWEKI